jgi:hypothetical protein
MRPETSARPPARRQEATLIDILDRVLDKGLVITGDIKVSLADVELLTIRIRLMLCSVEKAEEVGLDWWKSDPHFSSGREPLLRENAVLLEKVRRLERRVARLAAPGTLPGGIRK